MKNKIVALCGGLLALLATASCHPPPSQENLEKALTLSGSNRCELERVIMHCSLVMTIRILSLILLAVFPVLSLSARPDSLYAPKQEKVYLHTDKPYYLIGDTIWLKGYLVDAQTHRQQDAESRFLYVELINRKNKVVQRKKIMGGIGFSNFIALDKYIEEGEYQLRAYTRYMQNQSSDFFFTKQIPVYQNSSLLLNTRIEYELQKDSKYAVITLTRKDGTPYARTKVEYMVRSKSAKNHFRRGRTDDNGLLRFRIPQIEDGIDPYVYLTVFQGEYRIRRRIYLPREYDYTVGFYAEGGHLIAGACQKMAFKAESSTGDVLRVRGCIVNRTQDTLLRFSSNHLGMGSFVIPCVPADSLWAVTYDEDDRQHKFLLPAATTEHLSLAVRQDSSSLHYRVLVPEGWEPAGALGVLAHTRGTVVANSSVTPGCLSGEIPLKRIPEGITCLTLFNADSTVVSERLCFVRKKSAVIQAAHTPNPTGPRSLIKFGFKLLDESHQPQRGEFSISVTDDYAVDIDSAANGIYSCLLLTSDLKGHIHSPGYYFASEGGSRMKELDDLLLTQGWKRFPVKSLLRRSLPQLTYPVETEQRISGYVQTHFDNKRLAGFPLLVTAGKKEKKILLTDSLGCFSFSHSMQQVGNRLTEFTITGHGRKKTWRYAIHETKVPFPKVDSLVWAWGKLPQKRADFIKEVQEGYTLVNGERVYQLPEVNIDALRLPESWMSYYQLPKERIEQIKGETALDIVKQIPGILWSKTREGYTTVFAPSRDIIIGESYLVGTQYMPSGFFGDGIDGSVLSSRAAAKQRSLMSKLYKPIPVLVDGKRIGPVDELEALEAADIKTIDLVRETGGKFVTREEGLHKAWERDTGIDPLEAWEMSLDSDTIFLSDLERGGRYISSGEAVLSQLQRIYITTYRGQGITSSIIPYIARVGYLSYAPDAQFYAPQYSTEKSREIVNSDNRTTIHWEPRVRLNEKGEAGLSFYTADRPSTYTVVIEGITTEGKVCRFVKKIK